MTQISISAVGVEFGGSTLLHNVTATIARGEKWGVIGRNGSGKTTLFRLITGTLAPTRGSVARQTGLRIAMLDQHRDFGDARTVWDAVAAPFADLVALEHSLAEQAAALASAGERATPQQLERYGHDLERFAHLGGYEMDSRVDAVLHGLGFSPAEARVHELDALSGGERARVGLAQQLVMPADVLLLDEPTNHLDLDTSRWLETHLRETTATVIVVSHDRAFLDAIVDHVLHLESGTGTPYVGGYAAFVEQRLERRLAQQRAYDQQRRSVAREEDYIRRNIAGQNSRQAKGRRKRLERLPRLSPPPSEEDTMALRLEAAERGGDRVAELEHVGVDVGLRGARRLISDFSATVHRGDVIGLVGANGSGKSTLLDTLLGEHEPSEGNARTGASIRAAYYRQDLTQVPLDRSLYDVITELRPLWGRGAIQGHLGRFGFSGEAVLRSAGSLSGGERARLALAMIMLSHANLLVLDEPTNHLDVESIEALEDAIGAYNGTVILVSHDRELLRALTTRIWALDRGRIEDFAGGFADWEVATAERASQAEARTQSGTSQKSGAGSERRSPDAQRSKSAQRPPSAGRQSRRRASARELEAAEAAVMTLESRASELTLRLADPALYSERARATDVAAVDAELRLVRAQLADAMARWERAMEEDDTGQ